MKERLALFTQFAISAGLGCLAYWWLYPDENPKVPIVGAFIAGFGGLWLVMYIWNAIRYGREAARSMTMDG